MKWNDFLTQELCREMFDYRDGKIYWKKSKKPDLIGKEAGCVQSRRNGNSKYRWVNFWHNGKKHFIQVSSIVWYWHGFTLDPGHFIDHINRDSLDNRIDNLRSSNLQTSAFNRRSRKDNSLGYRGIKAHGTGYIASLNAKRKTHRSKRFDTPLEAAKAYDELAKEHHGEWAVLNFSEA